MVWLQGGVNALISSVPKRVNNMNHESTTKTRSGERVFYHKSGNNTS
jgi:hypothetical protein